MNHMSRVWSLAVIAAGGVGLALGAASGVASAAPVCKTSPSGQMTCVSSNPPSVTVPPAVAPIVDFAKSEAALQHQLQLADSAAKAQFKADEAATMTQMVTDLQKDLQVIKSTNHPTGQIAADVVKAQQASKEAEQKLQEAKQKDLALKIAQQQALLAKQPLHTSIAQVQWAVTNFFKKAF